MEKSDCKGNWVGKGDGLAFCPIHNQHFWTKKQQTCKFYSDGTTPDKKVEPLKVEQGVEQGVTSLTRKKSLPVYKKDEWSALIRSHAFRFVLRFNNSDKWKGRDKILKSKGFSCEPKGGIGRVFMSKCFNYKCWFADKSITIYFPSMKQYFVDEARFGYNYALSDLFDLLIRLEDVFGVSFKIDGSYRFKVSGQHHALIHNSLAKMYNRNKEKLHVYDDNNELWLLIDNSSPDDVGLNELENVHPTKAVDDSDIVREDWNDLRSKGLSRNVLANNIQALIEDRKFWAENQKTHVASIQTLSGNTSDNTASIRELKDVVTELKDVVKSSVKESVKESDKPLKNNRTYSRYDVERKERVKNLLRDWGW